MAHRALTASLVIVWILGAVVPSTAETIVYSTDFEDCTAGDLTGHPGAADQDWWYRSLSGDASAQILGSGGDPGRCLELYAPITNASGVQTYGYREFDEWVDLTQVAIVRLSFDVFCRSSDTTTQNLYRADVEAVGGPHPGFLIGGVRLVSGQQAPRDVTGLDVQVFHSPVGSGGLPIPLTVGQDLAWDTWHHVQLVIDHAGDEYVSITVNGETQDIAGYRPPRSWYEGEFLRGQRLEKVQGVIYASEWGDPVQQTDDWVRYDDLAVQVEYSPAPRLLSVTDVGNDQGRQVRLEWLRSEYDGPTAPTILSYDIYRREDSGAKLDGWDYVASVPAAGDDVYQCVVPTLGDSTSAGIWWSSFLLRAMTDDPLVYYQSVPDSGYSVDDLVPEPTSGFAVSYTTEGVYLSWSPSTAPDFLVFRLYRTRAAKAQELVCETTATSWHDDTGTWGDTYRLAVVDDAGNECEAAAPTTTTDAPVPLRSVVLHAPVPNPFNPATELSFELPSDGTPVQLRVYDTAGRRVCTLVDDVLDHGRHEVVWSGVDDAGHAAASGTYHARLSTPDATRVVKLTLVR